jgi:hypothetical protein
MTTISVKNFIISQINNTSNIMKLLTKNKNVVDRWWFSLGNIWIDTSNTNTLTTKLSIKDNSIQNSTWTEDTFPVLGNLKYVTTILV